MGHAATQDSWGSPGPLGGISRVPDPLPALEGIPDTATSPSSVVSAPTPGSFWLKIAQGQDLFHPCCSSLGTRLGGRKSAQPRPQNRLSPRLCGLGLPCPEAKKWGPVPCATTDTQGSAPLSSPRLQVCSWGVSGCTIPRIHTGYKYLPLGPPSSFPLTAVG